MLRGEHSCVGGPLGASGRGSRRRGGVRRLRVHSPRGGGPEEGRGTRHRNEHAGPPGAPAEILSHRDHSGRRRCWPASAVLTVTLTVTRAPTGAALTNVLCPPGLPWLTLRRNHLLGSATRLQTSHRARCP